ncbi:MAG: two-component system phosphate regulon sensor histidine kinase PhoR [Alphaproteobacteria bacterium]|nr:two-component system phosphate regulon sensor histidine kinase PhoR [Alphaproteobacteria bacterium]
MAATAGLLAMVGAATASQPLALLLGLGAGAALTLAIRILTDSPQKARAAAPSADPQEAPLPDLPEVLDAFDDPLLFVRDRRVVLANPAARALLGEHIADVDVRLAIRHPGAAEQLADRPGDNPEGETRTELFGLGDPGDRWEMTVTRLADGSRIVRLADRSPAHAAEQMRVDFVANASHELRTPLATLLGFLETLQDEDAAGDPRTRRRFLNVMNDEARRMRSLVDDLMSLSRIEAERYTVPRDPVDLLPLIDEVRQSCARLLEEKQAQLRVENEAGETVVAGDRSQLAQLVNNLLSNAARYGRPGTAIRIRLDDAGAELIRLAVIDQGEGIAAEHLPRLTERFYRIDPGRSRSIGGTGLGLAIVKHIVGRHRGRLDIRSKPGEGTSVRVYLPRAQGRVETPVTEVSRS